MVTRIIYFIHKVFVIKAYKFTLSLLKHPQNGIRPAAPTACAYLWAYVRSGQ